MYWKEQKTLLLSDIHAGKATHFRNNGIPLSTDHLLRDLDCISYLMGTYDVDKLSILGDLYHTAHNAENTQIDVWLKNLETEVELVIGNHDIHSLGDSDISCTLPYINNGILLSHEPEESNAFNICGHLHPSFTITGKGRQRIKMAAFYHSKNRLILPAFGSINGGKMYKDLIKQAEVYVTGEAGILKV